VLFFATVLKKPIVLVLICSLIVLTSLRTESIEEAYTRQYDLRYTALAKEFNLLERTLKMDAPVIKISNQIERTRIALKKADMWLRYSNPIAYKFLNGPLPVEWEVEVFEKWEKPYKREAAGLSLLQLALEENVSRNECLSLVTKAIDSLSVFSSDKLASELTDPSTFYFANRLHLLNLATIYTTGFECPDPSLAIPEAQAMLEAALEDYELYNIQNSSYEISDAYLLRYSQMIDFVKTQPQHMQLFDHFTFIKDFVNPLFTLNQLRIQELKLTSTNVNDYSLNNDALSIFDKKLYKGLENKGVFKGLKEQKDLDRLYALGEQLFNDPILSSNNQRSCASCHKPSQLFNDTTFRTSIQLDRITPLPRNTPSLVGSLKNHLLMLDGKHISAEKQAEEVSQNPMEMGLGSKETLPKILAIKTYKKELKSLAKKTINNDVMPDHIYSALIFYYSSFDTASSSLDRAMNHSQPLSAKAIRGFNLFMSKGECATCHFAPQYNGVKPPYVSSEFEVVGTPTDTSYSSLSTDIGRGKVHNVPEMQNAFRTPTLRNLSHTHPYMHNGVFNTIDEVLEFYNSGGGAGNGLTVPNQTLNSNELDLTAAEKSDIKAFLLTLNENIKPPNNAVKLPKGKGKFQNRKTTY